MTSFLYLSRESLDLASTFFLVAVDAQNYT